MNISRKHIALLVMVTTIPMILGYIFTQYPEVHWNAPEFHYYYIILSSIGSLFVGIFAYKEYTKSQDFKIFLLSIGFIGITIFYSMHGFVTPGKSITDFAQHAHHINAFVFFGDLSRYWIGVFLFFLVMSTRNTTYSFNKLAIFLIVILILVSFSLVAVQFPDMIPTIKDENGRDTHYAELIKVVTLVLLGVACTRFLDSYRILNNTPILTLVIACILIMETVVLFMLSTPWSLLWWMAHNLYLLSFVSVGFGLYMSNHCSEKIEYFNIQSQINDYINQLNEKQQELLDTNQKLNELARKDPLTGLPNRNYINYYMGDILAQKKKANAPIAILFIDLDGFKSVNDQHGHDIGDKLLKAVAELLQTCVRANDIVSRLGGDEFLVILQEVCNRKTVVIVTERIMESLTQPIQVDNKNCTIGASIGISMYPQDGEEFEQLIRKADVAMYWVKENGKNAYSFYGETVK
ncbi:hypothetical protein BHU72_00900 [Desulfuribacillus stibiiarsenatis]|uniref:GGDEF domain-containing protein n=1 Tax=Desulfuribacillus stibiiarsenatis TaxID=1390249 RepID=A0A1E5L9Z5_9FIRM|nr:GGDEF domain-containing protein [Desulfuribacillus stibiiarsenatis]OEH86854.1 hypothetical protein BHU72_00900 [Desulfuribacillus stibiiarsenatis]